MRTRPLGTLGVALLVAATLASTPVLARSSPAAASFPVALTQKQAVQVVLDYYKENNQANSTLSTALQNQDEEGISAEMDNANYKLLGLEGKTSRSTSATRPSRQPSSWPLSNSRLELALTR